VSILWRAASRGLEVREADDEKAVEAAPRRPSRPRPSPAVEKVDFRGRGAKLAAFSALLWLLRRERWFATAALEEAIDSVPNPKVRASMQKALARQDAASS
jgi:hypothetical protein